MTATQAPTAALRVQLQRALSERGEPAAIERLERRPCEYRTSFGLEELDVALAGGRQLRVMFKDLGRASLDDDALRAKPAFLHDPLREIEVYRDVLDGAGLGTAAYHGSYVDPEHDRFWLFIENVSGPVLWQVGEFDVYEETARRLARMHVELAHVAQAPPASLLRYGPDLYRTWITRARDFSTQPEVRWLAERYEPVVERLAALPSVFVHGEFYPSNVLVQDEGDLRICPIDWEVAAVGPALLDVAALTIGKWTPAQREALERAYRDALERSGRADLAGPDFDLALECARLHLAVQGLGGDPLWQPPADHRHDWLAEAMTIAKGLGL